MAALLLAGDSEDRASRPSKQQRPDRDGVACSEADSVAALEPIELRHPQQFRAAKRLPATHPPTSPAIACVAENKRKEDTGEGRQGPPGHAPHIGPRSRANQRRQLGAGWI